MTVQRRFWMRWRVRLGYPVALVYWLLATPSPRWILIGGMVAALGLMVRASAAGYLRKSEDLAMSGPYARTRNPLYFGSALIAAGFSMAGFSWPGGAAVMLYFCVFYYAVMRNEEEELRERYGQAFDNYAARVPLFFPRLADSKMGTEATAQRAKEFSWRQYRRNREYQALIGMIAGLVALWLRMLLRARAPWLLP